MKKIFLGLTAALMLTACNENRQPEAMTSVDSASVVTDLMMSRRSIRAYKDSVISRDTLNEILKCGIHAPNGQNLQSYEIRVIDSPALIDSITQAVVKDYPNEQDAKLWKEVVFRELSAGRPVLYGGTSYKNGEANYFSHSFVIDGYDKQGRVHVNYGYGGKGDGYFPIDKLPMKFDGWDETFDTYQTLVVIHRPQDGEIDYTLQPQ